MSAIAQGKESGGSDSGFQTTSQSERFDQSELSDLMRDLNVFKDSLELLAFRLKESNVLQPGMNITFCSRLFCYSRSLGLLAPVIYGMVTYIQEPLEIGRRGSMGKCLNGNTLAAFNGHLASVEGVKSRTREMWVWECQQR
jgi:hypothetical protein